MVASRPAAAVFDESTCDSDDSMHDPDFAVEKELQCQVSEISTFGCTFV